jgi:creatinine amidohydrolase
MAFPGTISLKPSTLLRVTSDLVGSLARHGFRRIMLLNGHGGNIASLNAGVCEIGEAYPDIFVKVRSWWELAGVKDIVDEVFGELEGWHATPGETSIVMALHPGIVSDEPVDVFETELPLSWTSAPRWAQLFPDGSVSSDVNLASGEVGERIISACVQALEDELRRW